ncbi:MAG: GGDEF domain-containing protein [Roseburia sp.]|nr:GGDEF domain-containing protein [Roseburia sp.]
MEKKKLFQLVGGIILLLILIALIITYLNVNDTMEGGTLDEFVRTEALRADGRTEYYDSNYFETVGMGDVVTAYIPLPMEKKIKDGVLCCNVYNCIVTLYYKDEVLYTYGEGVRGQIGNVLVCGDIPEEAWGEELRLECIMVDHTSFSKINSVTVCEAKNRTQYLLNNRVSSYMISIMIFLLFGIMFFLLLFWKNGGRIRREGLYLSSFCVGITMWQMGYEGMFYVTSNNVPVCGNAEYIGLFIAPVPFCLFLSEVEHNTFFRRLMKILARILFLVFFLVTILNYTTKEHHYCRYITIVHGGILVIAVAILAEFILVRTGQNLKEILVRYAVLLYLFFAVLDLLLFYVDKIEYFHVNMGCKSVTSLGLYIFLAVLLISYMLHVMEYFIGEKEKERLEAMAYLDGMTAIPNRRACLEHIEGLKSKKNYSIVFIDVNNLKNANDAYGHDVGDELICFVADMVKDIFGSIGFCGRYGGDEFIAVVEETATEKIQGFFEQMEEILKDANEKKQFPFTASVAYGSACSGEIDAGAVEEVMRLADERMYTRKREMKQKGNVSL